MIPSIPQYIERRIRCTVPADSHIVSGSTPVVSFGNAQSSTTATLGLNPSRLEFLDRNGNELFGSSRRLATHKSLGISDLTNAKSEVIDRVLGDCRTYFHRNPYRRWFDQLEPILNACGASYYNGSACHLDLIQWTTDPTWSKLRSATQRCLLSTDVPFLIQQLRNENIRLLLVNGMGVVKQLRLIIDSSLEEVDPIIGIGHIKTRLFVCQIFDRTRVVAWSTNIQSSFGVSNGLRSELSYRVKELARVSIVV